MHLHNGDEQIPVGLRWVLRVEHARLPLVSVLHSINLFEKFPLTRVLPDQAGRVWLGGD